MSKSKRVDMLILGAGWTSKFLIPQLEANKVTYSATTTTGHDHTIPFKFDPASGDTKPYEALPPASTILITFPLKGHGEAKRLTELYASTHPDIVGRWIQLGSTRIFQNAGWNAYDSPYDKSNPRAIAEDELLGCSSATVLNLAGLYDDNIRRPMNWVSRIAKAKADVKAKQALNLIHGADVARAVIACHKQFSVVKGQRWIITDLFVYDWWALLFSWGGKLEDGSDLKEVVMELMIENGVHALPRRPEDLGRVLDSKSFWSTVGALPMEGSIS